MTQLQLVYKNQEIEAKHWAQLFPPHLKKQPLGWFIFLFCWKLPFQFKVYFHFLFSFLVFSSAFQGKLASLYGSFSKEEFCLKTRKTSCLTSNRTVRISESIVLSPLNMYKIKLKNDTDKPNKSPKSIVRHQLLLSLRYTRLPQMKRTLHKRTMLLISHTGRIIVVLSPYKQKPFYFRLAENIYLPIKESIAKQMSNPFSVQFLIFLWFHRTM